MPRTPHHFDQRIPNNLPQPTYSSYIGRQEHIEELFTYLSDGGRERIIPIVGIGGIGKTSLALEVGHRIADEQPGSPHFDAIIWTSAQRKQLTTNDIIEHTSSLTNLDDLFRAIAEVLENKNILKVAPAAQRQEVRNTLDRDQTRRMLLIVDNLDELDDGQVYDFLRDDVPGHVTILMTSRENANGKLSGSPVSLGLLSSEDMRQLVLNECRTLDIALTDEQITDIIELAQGLPLAARLIIGYVSSYQFDEAIRAARAYQQSTLLPYIFAKHIERLKAESPQALAVLLVLTFFNSRLGGQPAVIAQILDQPQDACWAALGKLRALCLVEFSAESNGIESGGRRFTMLPILRQYLERELATRYEAIIRQARTRWIAYYKQFTSDDPEGHGGRDWKNFAARYRALEAEWPNLLEVFQWCTMANRYRDLRVLWDHHHVRDFANIRGLWTDRQRWLLWLQDQAITKKEARTIADCQANLAYMLIHLGGPENLNQAEVLLRAAWDIQEALTKEIQLDVCCNLVLLFTRQRRYTTARDYLAKYTDILRRHRRTLLRRATGERDYTRHHIEILYYTGMIHYEQDELDEANKHFMEMHAVGARSHYDRAIIFALNYLGDIARKRGQIETDPVRKKAHFEQAEQYLRQGLDRPECQADLRRCASFWVSLALLAHERKDWKLRRDAANNALAIFDRLGMMPDERDQLEKWARP